MDSLFFYISLANAADDLAEIDCYYHDDGGFIICKALSFGCEIKWGI